MQFDLAIRDLEFAAKLIEGTEDVIEPDGIPNKLNQPVSSLHTNIYYHLGLAYYLKGDLDNALRIYEIATPQSPNDDMRVAAAYWQYLSLARQGREPESIVVLGAIDAAPRRCFSCRSRTMVAAFCSMDRKKGTLTMRPFGPATRK